VQVAHVEAVERSTARVVEQVKPAAPMVRPTMYVEQVEVEAVKNDEEEEVEQNAEESKTIPVDQEQVNSPAVVPKPVYRHTQLSREAKRAKTKMATTKVQKVAQALGKELCILRDTIAVGSKEAIKAGALRFGSFLENGADIILDKKATGPIQKFKTQTAKMKTKRSRRCQFRNADHHLKGGQIAKVMASLTNEGSIALSTAAQVEQLYQAFPPIAEDERKKRRHMLNEEVKGKPIQCSKDKLIEWLNDKPDVSTGLYGFGYEHLRCMVNESEDFVNALMIFINGVINGEFYQTKIQTVLGLSKGITIPKKNSEKFRTIGIGNPLLQTALAMAFSAVNYQDKYHPLTVGDGAKGAIEIVVTALNAHLNLPQNHRHVLVMLDMRNAFNEMYHSAIILATRRRCPDLEHVIRFVIAGATGARAVFVTADEETKETEYQRGMPQGNFASPKVFSYTSEECILDEARSSFPDATVTGLLDDIKSAMSLEDALKFIRLVQKLAAGIGLHLNLDKSSVFIPHEEQLTEMEQAQLHEIRECGIHVLQKANGEGVEILGVPVGHIEFIKSVLKAKVEEVEGMFDKLCEYKDAGKSNKLRYLVQVVVPQTISTKCSHLLRSISPAILEEVQFVDRLETALENGILKLLDMAPDNYDKAATEAARKRIHLPFELGGLDIPSVKMASLTGYVGACVQVLEKVFSVLNIDTSNERAHKEALFLVPGLTETRNTLMSLPAVQENLETLGTLRNMGKEGSSKTKFQATLSSLVGKARNQAVKGSPLVLQHPNKFFIVGRGTAVVKMAMRAAYNCRFECEPSDREYRFTAAMTLGLPMYEQLVKNLTCQHCQKQVINASNNYSSHMLSCPFFQGYATGDHNRNSGVISQGISQIIGKLGSTATEVAYQDHLQRTESSIKRRALTVMKSPLIGKRRADHRILIGTAPAREYLTDHSYCLPANSRVNLENPYAITREREKRKITLLQKDFKIPVAEHGFVPIAITHSGVVGEMGEKFVRHLAKEITKIKQDLESEEMSSTRAPSHMYEEHYSPAMFEANRLLARLSWSGIRIFWQKTEQWMKAMVQAGEIRVLGQLSGALLLAQNTRDHEISLVDSGISIPDVRRHDMVEKSE
jgi:hypothetical protein